MTSRPTGRRAVAAGLLAGAVSAANFAVLRRRPAASERWVTRNFRDREVTLLLGPAIGLGALAGIAAAGPAHRRHAMPMVAIAATVGCYDDLYGDRHARGIGGHLRALRERRVTTGLVKLVTLGAVAIATSRRQYSRPLDVALGSVLVAGTTNLINLFDLRPGRAGKVTLAAAAALVAAGEPDVTVLAAVAAGAALAALPDDLGERAMLGDGGANTLGALLGLSAGGAGSRRSRSVMAALVVGLTAASERVSFSQIIESHSALRALDQWGRRPA